MDMERQVADAIVAELERQAETGALSLDVQDDETISVQGPLNLEALAMAVVGAVAGGP